MKFKGCLRVENIAAAAFLITERNSSILCNPLLQQLAALIDGCRTVEEIAAEIRSQSSTDTADRQEIMTLAEIYYALMQLKQKGYIVSGQDPLPADLAIFCEHLNIAPEAAHSRLQATKVSIKTCGSKIPAAQFRAALESLQIQVSEAADIEIVLTDDYLQAELSAYNQQSLASSRVWMLVKPVGTVAWLGPIFRPGQTGCWQCLAQRLQNNRPVEAFIQRHKEISMPLIPPLASLPATMQTALGMAATEVFKLIVQGENKRLEGTVVTYDALTLKTQNHSLVKRPQCPACGNTAAQSQLPRPVVLDHRQKPRLILADQRSSSAEATFNSYQHHISPITGVVRELQKLEATTGLIHTYAAKHHFATLFDDRDALRQYLIGRSGGTGPTDIQAKCSSFCEAIERYSGVFQGDEIRQKASYLQIEDKAIHPNVCMNFSQAQYQMRQDWNAKYSSFSEWFQKVPEPFDQAREIDWTPVWSLTQQDFKYLPTAYCYYGFPTLAPFDCWADANGCAAGNTLEDAIVQGLMELVERDSAALWWYNRLRKPSVDLASFNQPYFQALQNYYQTLKREFWVLDITSDLQIPAFVAISRRIDREIEDIIFDFGADFEPQTAVYKALNGMNKILHAVLAVNPDGSTRYTSALSQSAIHWWQTATLANQPYLRPEPHIAAKKSSDYPQLGSDDWLEDLCTGQQIIEKQGMELLVLDQTRADIGLNVVKVIVPGLRHFWQRFAPGRLYDVPVQLGWLPAPLQEAELNPIPIWM